MSCKRSYTLVLQEEEVTLYCIW